MRRPNPLSRLSAQGGELVEVRHVRGDGAVPTADLRIRWLDDEVLIWCVCPAAVAETVVTGGEADRRIGEDVAGIRARETRQQDRVDPAAPQHREHRFDDRRIGGGGRWI